MGVIGQRGAEDGLRPGHVRIVDVAVLFLHGLQEGVHGSQIGIDDPVKARGEDIEGIVEPYFHDDGVGVQFPDQLKDLFIAGLKTQQSISDGCHQLRHQRCHTEDRIRCLLDELHGLTYAEGTDGIHILLLGIFRTRVRFAGTQLQKDPFHREPQIVDADAHGDEVGFRKAVPDLFLQHRKLLIDIIRMHPVVHVVIGDRIPVVSVLQEHEHLLSAHTGGAVGMIDICLQRIGHDLSVGSLHRNKTGIDARDISGQRIPCRDTVSKAGVYQFLFRRLRILCHRRHGGQTDHQNQCQHQCDDFFPVSHIYLP